MKVCLLCGADHEGNGMYHDGCRMLVEEMGAKTVVKMEQPKWRVPAGESRAGWIRSIEQREGKWGPTLEWGFQGEDGTVYRGWTNPELEKLAGEWVRALVGEIPEEFDTDVLIGMPVRMTWAPTESGGSKIAVLARRQAEFKDFATEVI